MAGKRRSLPLLNWGRFDLSAFVPEGESGRVKVWPQQARRVLDSGRPEAESRPCRSGVTDVHVVRTEEPLGESPESRAKMDCQTGAS